MSGAQPKAADVVIIGGGPTGLMLAGELGLAGTSVILVERLAAPTGLSKALGLQSRSMEILDQRGILERFEAGHAPAPFVQFALFPIDLRKLVFPHPHTLGIPQAEVEAILEQWARELGCDIRRGHAAISLTQDDAGVSVEVSAENGTYAIRAPYAVGCDGAHSLVRHTAAIDFRGTDPTAIGRLGDFRLDARDMELLRAALPDLHGRDVGVFRTATGNFAIVPLGNAMYRLAAIEWGHVDVDREAPVTLEEMRTAIRRVTSVDLPLVESTWMSRTTDTARLAACYRSGRLFLAGDAAHIHFAYGGMGLQTGLQDASNLGWKLAAEIRGWAPRGLLETYHQERHPVGERLMMSTRAQVLLSSPGDHVTALRQIFSELLQNEATARHIAELFTSVDVHYAMPGYGEHHPYIGTFAPNLHLATDSGAATVAQLMRQGHGLLLDLGFRTADLCNVAAGWSDRVRIVRGSCWDGPPPMRAALIRPDGYIAWAIDSDSGDAAIAGLKAALQTWFGDAQRRKT